MCRGEDTEVRKKYLEQLLEVKGHFPSFTWKTMITALFQGFVRIIWHNPEKLTHAGKYNRLANPNEVRLSVFVVGHAEKPLCHCCAWVTGV